MDIYFRYSDNLMIYSYGYFFPPELFSKNIMNELILMFLHIFFIRTYRLYMYIGFVNK